MKKIISIILVCLVFSIKLQAKNTDSLISILPTLHDSDKIGVLYSIVSGFTYKNPDQSKVYADEAMSLLRKNKDTISTFYARFNTQLSFLSKA